MKKLNIIYTSDTHGYLFPTDYTDRTLKPMGLLALKNSIHKEDDQLIIDGGDTIQGSPFSSYLADSDLDFKPIASTMNAIGYDYVTLGNHDFNYGYKGLKHYLSSLEAKPLCANVTSTTTKDFELFPYDIRTMPNGLVVGIIGITTDHINIWERAEHLEQFDIVSPFEVAKHWHDKIRDEVDILIGLYHGGFENDVHTHERLTDSTENIGYQLCRHLNFDLLLTGHQHMAIVNHNIHGTHIVQTPANLASYGNIHIELDDRLVIESTLEQPIITDVLVPQIANIIDAPLLDIEQQVQIWLDEPIGLLDKPMTPKSHIEMATKGSPLTDFINHIQMLRTKADISCTSLANQVKGLPNEVTRRDVVATYVYPNTLFVLEVSGHILKEALERCAQYFALTDEGNLKVSDTFLKPKVEHYNYDFFAGIEYTIDVSKPLGARVTSLQFKGQTVEDHQLFSMVMNNYRKTGTGGYPFYAKCNILHEDQISTQDMVIDYIAQTKNMAIPTFNSLKIIGTNVKSK